jgi:hypothetical protein
MLSLCWLFLVLVDLCTTLLCVVYSALANFRLIKVIKHDMFASLQWNYSLRNIPLVLS